MDDLACGFYTWDGYWFDAIITNEFHWQEPPLHTVTRALYQDEGVIDETARVNGLVLDGCATGWIALNTPSVVGWQVYIRPNTEAEWRCVKVADTARREHSQHHAIVMQSGLELSKELSDEYGNTDYWDAVLRRRYIYTFEVCLSDDPSACNGDPVNYTDWYIDNARYVES
jgi:hypothetical protein